MTNRQQGNLVLLFGVVASQFVFIGAMALKDHGLSWLAILATIGFYAAYKLTKS